MRQWQDGRVDPPWNTLFIGLAATLAVFLILTVVLHVRRTLYFAFPGFPFSLAASLFLTGALADVAAWKRIDATWPAESFYHTGVLTAPPQQGERSVRCEVRLLGRMEPDGLHDVRHRVQLVVPRTPAAERLQVGDGIAFMGRIERPRNTGNPDEFDYAGFLLRRGLSGRAFVYGSQWTAYRLTEPERAALPELLKLRIHALRRRDDLLRLYRNLWQQDEPYAVLAALTLGEKSSLTPATKRLFADAGASHLLALSGLHLGLLLVVFQWLLLRRLRYSPWRWPAAVGVVVMLWGYVFLTGFPASLVRAALMTSLFLLGNALRRRPFTLNSLGLAALLMLCIDPFYLFDVGCQLSFLSLFAILTLQPSLEGLLPVRRPWLRRPWRLFTVSLAAQIGTAPLVAYVFHSLSVYAAALSLVLIPLTMCLVYGTVALLALHFLGLPFVPLLAAVLDKGVSGLSGLLAWSRSLPGAVCDGLYPSFLQVGLCYALLLVLAANGRSTLRQRLRAVPLLAAGVAAVLLCGLRKNRLEPSIIFYHNRNCPAVHLVYSPAESYLLCARTDSLHEHTRYLSDTFWARRLSRPPRLVTPAFSHAGLRNHDGALCAPGATLLMVCDDRWERRKTDAPWPVDYLHVCRGFRGQLRHLQQLVSPKLVVLDASLTDYYLRRYRQECQELGWTAYEMRDKGALKVALK